MDITEHIYRGPRQHLVALPADHSIRCPFCFAKGWFAPGPCEACGVTGYASGTAPGYRRGAKVAQSGGTPDFTHDFDQEVV